MKLERTTEPAANPVSTALVEQHLRIDSGEDALVIAQAIKSATDDVERDTDRALINQGWTVTLDGFPKGDIFLPKGKVSSIDTFTYLSATGVNTALVEDTDYTLTTIGDVAILRAINNWPSPITTENDTVTIVYTVGMGAADTNMPGWVSTSILLKCQAVYDGTDVEKPYFSLIKKSKLDFDYSINDY